MELFMLYLCMSLNVASSFRLWLDYIDNIVQSGNGVDHDYEQFQFLEPPQGKKEGESVEPFLANADGEIIWVSDEVSRREVNKIPLIVALKMLSDSETDPEVVLDANREDINTPLLPEETINTDSEITSIQAHELETDIVYAPGYSTPPPPDVIVTQKA